LKCLPFERFSRSRSFICARNLRRPRHGVGVTSVELLDACSRLVDLFETRQDIPFLGNLIQREIIYRLLPARKESICALSRHWRTEPPTAKAVEWLRVNYTKPLRVEELAAMARMGVSTLHHQFRSLTLMSPLQYQKQLRLHVARERMLNEGWMPQAPLRSGL